MIFSSYIIIVLWEFLNIFFKIFYSGNILILEMIILIMICKFLIHANTDYVGVATYDIKNGEEVNGVYLDNSKKTSVKAIEDISLGHKIALKDIKRGEKLIEYGEPIGQATKDIKKGEHVHVHNIKTMRW